MGTNGGAVEKRDFPPRMLSIHPKTLLARGVRILVQQQFLPRSRSFSSGPCNPIARYSTGWAASVQLQ